MHPLEWIGRAISRISKEKEVFSAIKSDPEKRATSKHYGVKSIIFSLLAVLFASSIFVLNDFSLGDHALLELFGLLCTIALAYIGPATCAVYSITYSTLQLVLNRKFVSWLALLFTLVSIVLAALIIFVLGIAQ